MHLSGVAGITVGNKSPPNPEIFYKKHLFSCPQVCRTTAGGRLQSPLVQEAHEKAQGWTQVCSLRVDAKALGEGGEPPGARSGDPKHTGPLMLTLSGHQRSQGWARVPETGKRMPGSAAQRRLQTWGIAARSPMCRTQPHIGRLGSKTPVQGG